MRLDAITGSMAALEPASVAQGSGPLNFVAADLEDILGGFAQSIANIHGSTAFTSQVPGKFEHATSKFIGILSASSHIQGAAGLEIAGQSDLKGLTHMYGDAQVDTLAANDGALVFHNTAKKLRSNDKVKFDGNDLVVASAKVSDLTDTRVVFAGPSGSLVDSANMVFDGTDLTVASAKVSDLTATRVVYAGASGALVDSAEMTFGAGGLTLAKDLSARSGSFSGDVTITGDLNVMGATTTIDTQNLLVKDAKIVISSGALVDGAGIYLADDSAGENIRWATADGGKWIASDKFAADTIQALDLSDAIVWADASGNLVEISNQQLADAMEARLAEGTGVHISEAGAVITVAIGQPVETTSVVTFAAVTGSNLTASRLMASNANKVMVSADLSAWVAGTANQVSVADDADGSITLSLPQSIHTDADVEFDTLKLGDYAADAGKAYKVGASGSIVPAAWDEFVAIEANVGLELVQNGFKAEIGLAQDIRTTASPEFVGMTLSGLTNNYLVKSVSGSLQNVAVVDFVAGTQYQVTVTNDGDGSATLSLPIGLTDASNGALVGFAATSVVGALNELAAGSGGGKGKWAEMLNADINNGAFTFASGPNWSAGTFDKARVDIYLNGQMMKETADYALSGARTVTFTFALKADDVVTARIC
jgi:hypothetical protein